MATTIHTTMPKSIKKGKKASVRALAKQSVDEFMSGNWDQETDDLSSETSGGNSPSPNTSSKSSSHKTAKQTKREKMKQRKATPLSRTAQSRKTMKDELKDADPEFYKFLQKEDQDLLEDDDDGGGAVDEGEDSDDLGETLPEDTSTVKKRKQVAAAKKAFEKEILQMSSGSEDSDEEGDGGIFQPPEKLQVASDDEDFEEDKSGDDDSNDSDEEMRQANKKHTKLITPAMIKSWTKQLQDTPDADALREVSAVLTAAALHAGIGVEASSPYRVEGNTVFNAIVRMCLTEVVPTLESLLKVKSLSNQPQVFSQKNKKWKSLRGAVKNYCTLMLQLCIELSEASMISTILRHIHKLVVCYAAFPKLSKTFLRRLIALWSGGEETTRVLAFLCISKLTRLQPETTLEPALKQMYMAYVNNCKFVSPSSLPLINFMQRSLVEVFLVQEALAYQYAFLYIRQLAIHLRNAIALKKKEMCQAVYNWQYVLSLGLWSRLLATAHPSTTLQPLVYPLIQVIIGTVRLLPTARYFPLRFHCVRFLTSLSGATNTFVPVVPFLLEVLELTDFNKKQKASSIKSFTLTTILKFSKQQLQERAFKEAVMEELCELLLEYLHCQSHTAAFPELIVPLVIQLKEFLRRCKVAVLCKQVREVLQRAEENAKVIEARRGACSFNLADSKSVESWESKNKEEGTPLSKFYESWKKLRDRQRQKDIVAKEEVLSKAETMPEITLPRGPTKASAKEREEFTGLFGDDDDDDDEEEDSLRFLPKGEKNKAQKPKDHVELDSDEEDYSDFDSDDWEQLAKSASEDDDTDEDDDVDDASEDEGTKGSNQGKKRKAVASVSRAKRGKVEIENDGGDIVREFQMSDFDSD